MKMSRDFMRFYLIPIVLIAGMFLTIGFIAFYTGTVRTNEGQIVGSNWPRELTLAFAPYISCTDTGLQVSDEGQGLLHENDLWLQILDKTGKEIFSVDKPIDIPEDYEPYELLSAYQYGTDVYSIFVSNISFQDESYTYLIGFPLDISKVTMYIDNNRYQSGRIQILAIVIITFLLMLVLTIYYNIMVAKGLTQVKASLRAVAMRNYVPCNKKALFRDIYEDIDLLNQDITQADTQRELDEKARQEWLANITHDLKTPLAPVRGYAELLTEERNLENTKRYSDIILKNTIYVEQLVDDLKLTYQLQSNSLPIQMKQQNLTRFVKEVVIDILNTPNYENRNILFDTKEEELICSFDAKLLRRAFTNTIINALKHNSLQTEVKITLECTEQINLVISDNGSGMTPTELEGLFQRYYRGTNTENKEEGTGLGMAIARQIIEAHGGTISAKSIKSEGTTIVIQLLK